MKQRPPNPQSPPRENLTSLNNVIAELTNKTDDGIITQGVLYAASKEKPFGLMLATSRGYSKTIKKLIKRMVHSDFYLSFPLQIQKILYKLSRLKKEVSRLKNRLTLMRCPAQFAFAGGNF